ncbi:MAG: hypothetical protein KGZ85_18135 [Ignavibacterium sp.]|nr:hypothetical protein [Ignavibacterium sp.]
MKYNFKKIFSRKLYRQGGACIPFFIATPYCGAFARAKGGFFYNCKEDNYGYFFSEEEKKLAIKIIEKQEKDKQYIEKLFFQWKKIADQQLNFCLNFKKKKIENLNLDEIISIHREIDRRYFKFWYHAALIELYDPWGDDLLEEQIDKYYGKNLPPEVINVMTISLKKSFLKKEYLDLFELVKKKIKGKITRKDIERHRDKYYWINNGWNDVFELDFSYFSKRIDKIIKNIKIEKEKYRKIKNERQDTLEKRRKFIFQYKFSKNLKNIFYFFEFLNFWRDFRKTYACKIQDTLFKIIKEYSRRTGVKIDYLKALTAQEIDLIKNKRNIKNLKKRWECCFMLYHRSWKYSWFIGRKAEKIIDLLEKSFLKRTVQIEGMIGNKGLVKGFVKIIKSVSDFKKMKKGNILVTMTTRTEFLPVMKKAKAIIADEGGITCHAAIVSRELSVPCIVGTQISTQVLKDGDLVEVDANKGIIRKIK